MILKDLGLTERELDSIQIIFDLTKDGWPARLTDFSNRMNVKPSTGEEFLSSLEKKGYVLKKNGVIKLTDKGMEIMEKIERNHRIVETFLYRMGMDIENAHRNAKNMEYYVTDEFIDNLCSLMGHPRECPHGNKIPQKEECCSRPQIMKIVPIR